ncbi:MAG TPA: tetratricopeptide repeat protein [bacterium]|nr:tetratricopeptide repeat protein [bacterium]
MSARRLLAALVGAAILGALTSAGAQQVQTSAGNGAASVGPPGRNVGFPILRDLKAAPVASKTPSLLEATPHGTPLDLHVDPDLESAMRTGEDMILDRRYDEALALFRATADGHKDSALGPLGQMLVWQSQMLENGDFAHRDEYDAAVKETGTRIDAVKSPGTWDLMLAGGYNGVRAMHAMREKHYLRAVDDGWSALSGMKSLKKKEPDLADSDVGLGTYDYWRSVITRNVKWIPFFSDKRRQGIQEIERAFVDAQYTRPIAQLVLVFIYIDEHRYDDAIALGEDMAAKYPHNTLVRVQVGRAYSRKGRYDDAVKIYEKVLELQPDNKVAHYFLGANLVYGGKDLDRAETLLTKFVADPPGNDWRGWGNERLGDLWMKRGDPDRAVEFWKKSQKDVDDEEGVKEKIAHAHDRKATPQPTLTPVAGKGPGTLP